MEKGIVKRGFASDNNAGIHPDILNEIISANIGHVTGYGSDIFTVQAHKVFKEQLGSDAEIFFVFTGTAANVLSLTSITRSWNSVITASTAHLDQDECGAPEKFMGAKVLTVDTPDGKITPKMLEKHMHGIDFEHHSQPKVISITQTTEMGTIYSVDEIKEIAGFAHSNKMFLHMDGARLANAAVYLGLPFKAFTTDAGVDVLSFGGTKNGMMFGEAICFLKPGLSEDFKYIRKQGMQLASKMRFISAQYIAYFHNDLWKKCASHSNRMAKIMAEKLGEIKDVKITQPVQSNGIFIIIPAAVAEKIRKHYFFYPWNDKISEYRLMTSWDTHEEDINNFIKILRKELF
ncbi:MAG: threonine aldolase [Bacteroidetes bacterium GWE2_41_25]|nr:MAG: threonine aldolase [Bacteroidetes bacterium GWA2_40_15]OFX92230.1 MAG: threonine aldolase [Bacteroidetes bacterium GWC2_40_22]OFY02039.1 MAG: threonine aldolase [Bacteroidetes bacterium GWE2_41_25]OFY57376.1 MAG: threonine aldolase [Bacteroidetes bacterium GWF2_41_9]HAM08874.1 threonine aldolase [Bacteroidales bacterium]